MYTLIWTVLAAFALAVVAGPFIIPWLKKLKFRQNINQFGPKSHELKRGTPMMGGIIFVLASLIATLIFADKRGGVLVWLCVINMLAFGLVGFLDDFLKFKRARSEGLTPRQKLAPQIMIAIAVATFAYLSPDIGSSLRVPFTDYEWNLGWAYIPVMVFILVGVVNSANLLDGLDGLCAGSAMLDFSAFALICVSLAATADGMDADMLNVALFSGAMAGALLGFLRFNSYPASVIMGDVGSFAIGGALAGVAMVTRLSLLLPILAFTMLISSLSDIVQIGYFKLTHGKRVLRMAPLHHHFELSGIPETKIVSMYNIVTALLCLLALSGYVGM